MAKAPAEIRSLARNHSRTALATLIGVMRQKDAPPAARVAAANAILDRGWGKPEMKLEAEHTHNYVARLPQAVSDIDEWKKQTAATLQ